MQLGGGLGALASSTARTPKDADLRRTASGMSASGMSRAASNRSKVYPTDPVYRWTLVTLMPWTASNRPRLPRLGRRRRCRTDWGGLGWVGGDGRLRADHDHRNLLNLVPAEPPYRQVPGTCGPPELEPDKSPELAPLEPAKPEPDKSRELAAIAAGPDEFPEVVRGWKVGAATCRHYVTRQWV
jgi:hypothetical protein